MKKKDVFLIILPFIICSILIFASYDTYFLQNNILLYTASAIFVSICVIALSLKQTGKAWLYVWTVFGIIFGIMAFDQLALNGNIYSRFFKDSVRGFDDFFFPSPIPFRGLIPFLIFYFILGRKKDVNGIKEKFKYSTVIVVLYCWCFFIANFYYGTPGVSRYLYSYGEISYNLFLLVNTLFFAIFIVIILKTDFVRLKLIYLLSFFFLIFVTTHGFLLFFVFKTVSGGPGLNWSDLIYLLRLYIKYTWIHSGAAYMILFLGYQSFRRRRNSIRDLEKSQTGS